MADDDARLTGVVVPDDISSLARDVAAYRKEVRRAGRRRLLARRGVVPALVITVATTVAAVVAVMLTVVPPRAAGRPPQAIDLANPTKPAGMIGGLLPHTSLRGADGSTVDTWSETLRPEVLALVPEQCGCGALLNALSGQAASEQLRLAIVVPAASDDSADSITAALDRGRPTLYFDPQATLATSVAGSGVTLVVVDVDGTIFHIERGVTDPRTTSLEAALQSMLLRARA